MYLDKQARSFFQNENNGPSKIVFVVKQRYFHESYENCGFVTLYTSNLKGEIVSLWASKIAYFDFDFDFLKI